MEPATPLFVVGSARSGNTLLYHTLLSTGRYAIYRGEPAVFDLLHPRYGDLGDRAAKRRLLAEWPRSHLARASGLDAPGACSAFLAEVEGTGDFLRRVMTRIAERQGKERWAVWGPDNLLLMEWIRRELPDARFIHVVRDGRDVALSLATEGWMRPFPWDADRALLVSALHWQWKLRRGRQAGRRIGDAYQELSFEALVTEREATLATVADFVGHPMNPDVIARESVGTLRDRNSTFRSEGSDPVGRWRTRLDARQVALVERAIGETLQAFGYALLHPDAPESELGARLASHSYPLWFTSKHVLRTHTGLGRMVQPGRLRLA